MADIYFRGGRGEAKEILRSLVGTIAGTNAQNADLATGVFHSVGFAALSDIQDDFLTKARGGTGVDGTKWAPLAPATLAYGRKAPRGRGHAPGGKDGLLTKGQLTQWRKIYGSRLARFAMSMELGAAKARAAAIAWAEIKRQGGKTKLAEYANRPHEIGRDTDILFNSLSPGELGGENGQTYSKPGGPGGDQQTFRKLENGIIVGTNVPYASGFAKRRPIFPKQAPQEWLDGWIRVAGQAITVAFRIALARGVTA